MQLVQSQHWMVQVSWTSLGWRHQFCRALPGQRKESNFQVNHRLILCPFRLFQGKYSHCQCPLVHAISLLPSQIAVSHLRVLGPNGMVSCRLTIFYKRMKNDFIARLNIINEDKNYDRFPQTAVKSRAHIISQLLRQKTSSYWQHWHCNPRVSLCCVYSYSFAGKHFFASA